MGTRGIPNHYGGFEQLAQYLSEGLAKKGHEVFVYNPHNHIYKEQITISFSEDIVSNS